MEVRHRLKAKLYYYDADSLARPLYEVSLQQNPFLPCFTEDRRFQHPSIEQAFTWAWPWIEFDKVGQTQFYHLQLQDRAHT